MSTIGLLWLAAVFYMGLSRRMQNDRFSERVHWSLLEDYVDETSTTPQIKKWFSRVGSLNAHRNLLLSPHPFFLGSTFVKASVLRSRLKRALARTYSSKGSPVRRCIPRGETNAIDSAAKLRGNHVDSNPTLEIGSSVAHDHFAFHRCGKENSEQPVALSRRAFLTHGAVAYSLAEPAIAEDSTNKRVFVAGARGRTGGRVLESLRTAGIEALAGVRAAGVCNDALQVGSMKTIQCDFTMEDASSTLATVLRSSGVTDIICTIGFKPTMIPETDRKLAEDIDFKATRVLIAASEAAELKGRFVLVSSLGVNATSDSARMLSRSLGNVLTQKRNAETVLRASRLDWVIVRPGLLDVKKSQGGILLGEADRWQGIYESDVVQELNLDGPLKCQSPFLASSGAVCSASRAQVADVCVAALQDKKFTRRVVEVVTHPLVQEGSMRWVS